MNSAPKADADIVCLSASARSAAAEHYQNPSKVAPAEPLVVDYSGMWFYNLVFGTIASANEILATEPKIIEIQKAVAKFYEVRVQEILSARRSRDIVRPRQVAFYLCKKLTLKSLPEIGRRFGGRDHTTALHAIRKIERLRAEEDGLELQLITIAKRLGGELI
jgi:hypothetical protein